MYRTTFLSGRKCLPQKKRRMETNTAANNTSLRQVAVIEDTNNHPCRHCNRRFKSLRGLLQHQRSCQQGIPTGEEINQPQPPPPPLPPDPQPPEESFYWGDFKGSETVNNINSCYEKIVYWRRNLFLLPKGLSGKDYIRETTRLLNAWTEKSPLRQCAMAAIHIMPALLLQKPSKSSKSKDHARALERRLKLWKEGEFLQLMREADALQQRLPKGLPKKDLATISREFRDRMQKGNINGAIRLLTNNMQGGVLPLNEETINLLHQKHPKSQEPNAEFLLHGPESTVEPVIFDAIDEAMVMKAAQFTKGGSGPSGLDGDGWRHILTSRRFGDAGSDLRVAIATFTRSICTQTIDDDTVGALMASRLIPLNKKPGLRPIGVGEVLRRIIGKIVMSTLKSDVVKSCANSQMCGHKSGSEAAIHAMKMMYERDDSDAVLLVDAENAFNSLNRKVLLHNIGIICPSIATFVRNCYTVPTRLFVIGGTEIRSNEGTTQGDPLGMAIYAIGTTPMLRILADCTDEEREAVFADDITAAGRINGLRKVWNELLTIGPPFGYFPKPSKSWLIVKTEKYDNAVIAFNGTNIQISTEGSKHLGAIIGSDAYKQKYLDEKVETWIREINLLSEIAITEPQAAYSCYTAGYQHKLTYFMRTIAGCEEQLLRVEESIRHKFIPALTGGHIINDKERQLLSLPPRLGGLGINIFSQIADSEYNNSKSVTVDLQEQITGMQINQEKKTRSQIKHVRQMNQKDKFDSILAEMSQHDGRRAQENCQKGVSNWLTSLPLKNHGFDLTKQEFRDAIKLRYGWALDRTPMTCVCGSKFDVNHALSCKRGGFVTLRHNEVRNITANLLNEVCNDVKIEPMLAELDGERIHETTGNRRREARLDVSAVSFWVTGQRAFFDIRVFDLSAQRYRNRELTKCFEMNEKEKKRQYNERVLEVEHGSFTPLVFSSNGGMGRECSTFYKRLSEMFAEKNKQPLHEAIRNIRTKISFSLLRSTIRCIRGSRSRKPTIENMELIQKVGVIKQ